MAIMRKINYKNACAYNEDRKCNDNCVAYTKLVEGRKKRPFCERGGFWIKETKLTKEKTK